jgi:hypothetical protein
VVLKPLGLVCGGSWNLQRSRLEKQARKALECCKQSDSGGSSGDQKAERNVSSSGRVRGTLDGHKDTVGNWVSSLLHGAKTLASVCACPKTVES